MNREGREGRHGFVGPDVEVEVEGLEGSQVRMFTFLLSLRAATQAIDVYNMD